MHVDVHLGTCLGVRMCVCSHMFLHPHVSSVCAHVWEGGKDDGQASWLPRRKVVKLGRGTHKDDPWRQLSVPWGTQESDSPSATHGSATHWLSHREAGAYLC